MKALFKLPANAKEVEDFKLFIDGELVSDICEEKNRYANQLLGSATANTKTLKVWVRTTHDEMHAFLGVVILMGIVVKKIVQGILVDQSHYRYSVFWFCFY